MARDRPKVVVRMEGGPAVRAANAVPPYGKGMP